MLKASQISFAYGRREILRAVSFAVERGEFVGLIGANGAGKTTLLRVLLNLLKPNAGEVLLDGDSIATLNRREIARRAAFVPQDTSVDFAFTAREIVAMGRTPHLGRFAPESARDQAAIETAMRTTETDVFANRAIVELSGGERQRVFLARALAQETALILLDEPTANLDLAHQFAALQTIQNTVKNQNRIALAAIHDLSLAARFCDRLILLRDGEIKADGAPFAVVTETNLQQHFGLRARVRRDDETGDLIVWPLGAN